MTTLFRNLATAAIITVAVGSSAALAQQAIAEPPPPVPSNIEVPPGNTLFLKGSALGTQNYVCLPSASGFSWTFFSPQATLFSSFKFLGRDVSQQIITHFLSPNPAENATGRATWQSSFDTSAVWARAVQSSTDPNFVGNGAIPWLLLQAVGTQRGPTGGDMLANATFIQRVSTVGGVIPATGCSQAADVGATALVPYSADYFFYKASRK